jgi:hypothetical protein
MEHIMKICRECKIEKEEDKFRHNTRVCRQCRNKKYNTINNQKNKDFIKTYYNINRDKYCKLARDRYYKNKELEQQLIA